MEVRGDLRPHLARAAAALTVLTFLPLAMGGAAHASPAIPTPFTGVLGQSPPEFSPRSSPLFASFDYDAGQVLGTYVQFAYDATNGTLKSVLGLAGEMPVLYVGSISIEGFAPTRGQTTEGATFEAGGYLVTVTAHDDPTVLIEIRTDMSRTATIELPASATNISLLAASGSWPASTVSYEVGEEQGRFLLGAGSFSVSGTRLVAKMMDSDLLVFKSVPPLASNRTEWRLVLDSITLGHVVAELDLVATSNGQWVQNTVRYRIGLAAWALRVEPGRAVVQVDSLLPGGAVILLGFDAATMPNDGTRHLVVNANGHEVNGTDDSLMILFPSDVRQGGPRFSVLALPGTVVALYLPSLAAISIEVQSVRPVPPNTEFSVANEIAMIAALAVVSAAAARMLWRRED